MGGVTEEVDKENEFKANKFIFSAVKQELQSKKCKKKDVKTKRYWVL